MASFQLASAAALTRASGAVPETPAAGSRVRVNHKQCAGVGIVRFVGTTRFKAGTWVGVELDDPVGKNDGCVDGVRYFNCPPSHGLFVRPAMTEVIQDAAPLKQSLGASSVSAAFAAEDVSMRDTSGSGVDSDERKAMDVADDIWFEIPARGFIFNKSSKQWIELHNGNTAFAWDEPSGKIHLSLADGNKHHIDHLVDLNTKIEQTIVSQQSWVFRAARRAEPSFKDVLCLQYSSISLASAFVSNFEACRASLLVSSTDTKQNPGAALHSLAKNDSKQQQQQPTRTMRRRLTLAGGDPRLDGHNQGMDTDQDSPKTMRSGAIGSWGTPGMGPVHVRAFSGVSRKGLAPYNPDKQNQDSMIMCQLPCNDYCNGELLLACFDGHGSEGHLVSRHIAARLPKLLASSPKFAQDEHTGTVLADALLTLEKELVDSRSVDTTLSGTTAVVSVIRNGKLFVANVGDSRIIKGSVPKNCPNGRVLAKDLSTDHKPDDERERKRITNSGGRVFAMKYDDGVDGPARVWLSYADMPGLAMSRSLCDTIGKEAGVISEAELHVHKLDASRDRFVVLASDGLWEFMSSQEVADIVAKHVESGDPRLAINELIRESNRRWQLEEPVIDDTTVIVAFIG